MPTTNALRREPLPFCVQLWKHESQRVMSDKFTDEAECSWFMSRMVHLVEQQLGPDMVPTIREPVYMADFLRESEEPEDENEEVDDTVPTVYEPIRSFAHLHQRLVVFLKEYNEVHRKTKMDLVLFEFAMYHLMRISRIIKNDRGNALLIGVGGSGKQSLTKLAAFIAGYKLFQIVMSKNYRCVCVCVCVCEPWAHCASIGTAPFTHSRTEQRRLGLLCSS